MDQDGSHCTLLQISGKKVNYLEISGGDGAQLQIPSPQVRLCAALSSQLDEIQPI